MLNELPVTTSPTSKPSETEQRAEDIEEEIEFIEKAFATTQENVEKKPCPKTWASYMGTCHTLWEMCDIRKNVRPYFLAKREFLRESLFDAIKKSEAAKEYFSKNLLSICPIMGEVYFEEKKYQEVLSILEPIFEYTHQCVVAAKESEDFATSLLEGDTVLNLYPVLFESYIQHGMACEKELFIFHPTDPEASRLSDVAFNHYLNAEALARRFRFHKHLRSVHKLMDAFLENMEAHREASTPVTVPAESPSPVSDVENSPSPSAAGLWSRNTRQRIASNDETVQANHPVARANIS